MIFALTLKKSKFEATRLKKMKAGVDKTIHLFALLHVATVLVCRYTGVSDEIWLTLLTIMMVVLLGIRLGAKVELTAAGVIVTNVLGFLLGTSGARLLSLVSGSELLIHSLATFATTEIIGWGIFGFLTVFSRNSRQQTSDNTGKHAPPGKTIRRQHILWLACALAIVLLFRMMLTLPFSSNWIYDDNVLTIADSIFSNSWILVMILCLVILTVRYLRTKCRNWSSLAKTAATLLSAIATSSAMAVAAGTGIFAEDTSVPFSAQRFMQLFVAALALYLICYSIVYMIDYALETRSAMYEAKGKADYAQFQYEQLRRQVNPHFLFNSLNILDCLVQDGQTEHASSYIHKLACIYRYMLRNDSKSVPLKDEMTFVGMYVDLLKERFGDGFCVVTDIPEDLGCRKHVIPCSIQMLIENAIKHNRVGGDGMLQIRIAAVEGHLSVSNIRRPKVSAGPTTKVGLRYLQEQYRFMSGKEIEILCDDHEFKVTIPLLDNNPLTV